MEIEVRAVVPQLAVIVQPPASQRAVPQDSTGVTLPVGDFSGTMGLSDFPPSFIADLCPWTSRRGLVDPPGLRQWRDLPVPRARCFHTCPIRLGGAQGPNASRASDAPGVASARCTAWASWSEEFYGSLLGPHVPLSTLHPRHRALRQMTRGRCGSLGLHRTTPPFAAPCRF